MADGAQLSTSGTADAYHADIARSRRYRVIRSRDDFQFIVQRRKPTVVESVRWPWLALAYVRNKKAHPSILQRASLSIPAEDLAQLLRQLTAFALAEGAH